MLPVVQSGVQDHLCGLLGDPALDLLALGVLLSEMARDFLSAGGRVGGQQLDGQSCVSHSAGCVQARRQHKPDVIGIELPGAQVRRLQQGTQPRVLRGR